MIGFGVTINCIGILTGGVLGLLFRRMIKEQYADMMRKSCGISVLFIGIERSFEKFGTWLKRKTKSDKDSNFINGFVNASLTVSIGLNLVFEEKISVANLLPSLPLAYFAALIPLSI